MYMSSNQHERLASESAEARKTRLHCVSSNQHERQASESAEARETRLSTALHLPFSCIATSHMPVRIAQCIMGG